MLLHPDVYNNIDNINITQLNYITPLLLINIIISTERVCIGTRKKWYYVMIFFN